MTKRIMKFISIMLLVAMAVSVAVPALATYDINQFDGKGNTGGADASLQNVIGAIITLVRIVGTGVAIIMLIVLAIKYISAAPGDKADIKKHAVVYVVGAVVLFAATGILGIVQKFASNIS